MSNDNYNVLNKSTVPMQCTIYKDKMKQPLMGNQH